MSEKHHYIFTVKSSQPPVIEIDHSSGALYLRFMKARVAKTIPSACPNGVINLDLSAAGEVIGIEAIGLDGLSIKSILQMANVRTPKIELANAPIRWAGALQPA